MTLKGGASRDRFGIALVAWGVPLVLIAPRPYLGARSSLLAVVGAANSLEDVAVFTLLQRIVPDEMLTRVLGLVLGSRDGRRRARLDRRTASWDRSGRVPRSPSSASILPLLTYHLPAARRARRSSSAPAAEVELIEAPMFAPLSLAAKERVSAIARSGCREAGEVVIRRATWGSLLHRRGRRARHPTPTAGTRRPSVATTSARSPCFATYTRTASVTATVDSSLYALRARRFFGRGYRPFGRARGARRSSRHGSRHTLFRSRASYPHDRGGPSNRGGKRALGPQSWRSLPVRRS